MHGAHVSLLACPLTDRNPKHAPASLLVEAEVLLPEEYAEDSDAGEGLVAVTRVAPQQEGTGMAVWNQLLTLRLGPEPEVLAAARLLLRVASSEEGGRKVVRHMQAELPLSSVLPGGVLWLAPVHVAQC
jgi:hypothetical protein